MLFDKRERANLPMNPSHSKAFLLSHALCTQQKGLWIALTRVMLLFTVRLCYNTLIMKNNIDFLISESFCVSSVTTLLSTCQDTHKYLSFVQTNGNVR